MDVAEPASGYRYELRGNLDVAVDFGLLAVQTGPHPGGDLSGEAFPDEPGADEAARGPHT